MWRPTTHRLPPDIREHERIFGCPVEFEAEHNRLFIDRATWETPTRGAHSGVLGVLIQHADLLLCKLPRGPELIERTRRAIGARLRGGDPSLENVARELGMSERSLQRHLRDLGFSYNAVADEVREATARLYLEQPDMALAEIGYLLGFADQSAFNRAFKRWTGCTPKQARTEVLRAAGERAGQIPRLAMRRSVALDRFAVRFCARRPCRALGSTDAPVTRKSTRRSVLVQTSAQPSTVEDPS
jgi:AraC-like DNA-binding protein